MSPQVSKEMFSTALREMGLNPEEFSGQRLTLEGMCKLYELEEDAVMDAVDLKKIAAHYDYRNDVIWVDALEAAHFYYCVKNESPFYAE